MLKNYKKSIDILYALLGKGQFNYADEITCQNQIAAFLTGHHVTYQREFRLGQGICDFYFPHSSLVLEVKAAKTWNKRKVYRQCERYCEDDHVRGLILATGCFQTMPPLIHHKPVKVFQLGRGFL